MIDDLKVASLLSLGDFRKFELFSQHFENLLFDLQIPHQMRKFEGELRNCIEPEIDLRDGFLKPRLAGLFGNLLRFELDQFGDIARRFQKALLHLQRDLALEFRSL